jgi:hypothetical protein
MGNLLWPVTSPRKVFSLLTDDVLALRLRQSGHTVFPAFPGVRLFSDSLTSPIVVHRAKSFLDLR